MKLYHDTEWGVPVHDDRKQFEFLMMEVMQCGLNWNMMLQKREVFRKCFDGFDYDKVAGYTDSDIERIICTEGMIRSERKIKAVIHNARCFQAAGFDGIIAAANRRLLPMSDGQFELFRQEDSLGKRSNTFLDLEVLDNTTGRRRPVGNLSGGESFKASLSLALGLSDTVSMNLGGIQMDALFVDEGFGTLDRKSIESAMDTLINLSGTGKMVGIISHREELMENIPQQIKVKKTKDGSRLTIETGL